MANPEDSLRKQARKLEESSINLAVSRQLGEKITALAGDRKDIQALLQKKDELLLNNDSSEEINAHVQVIMSNLEDRAVAGPSCFDEKLIAKFAEVFDAALNADSEEAAAEILKALIQSDDFPVVLNIRLDRKTFSPEMQSELVERMRQWKIFAETKTRHLQQARDFDPNLALCLESLALPKQVEEFNEILGKAELSEHDLYLLAELTAKEDEDSI